MATKTQDRPKVRTAEATKGRVEEKTPAVKSRGLGPAILLGLLAGGAVLVTATSKTETTPEPEASKLEDIPTPVPFFKESGWIMVPSTYDPGHTLIGVATTEKHKYGNQWTWSVLRPTTDTYVCGSNVPITRAEWKQSLMRAWDWTDNQVEEILSYVDKNVPVMNNLKFTETHSSSTVKGGSCLRFTTPIGACWFAVKDIGNQQMLISGGFDGCKAPSPAQIHKADLNKHIRSVLVNDGDWLGLGETTCFVEHHIRQELVKNPAKVSPTVTETPQTKQLMQEPQVGLTVQSESHTYPSHSLMKFIIPGTGITLSHDAYQRLSQDRISINGVGMGLANALSWLRTTRNLTTDQAQKILGLVEQALPILDIKITETRRLSQFGGPEQVFIQPNQHKTHIYTLTVDDQKNVLISTGATAPLKLTKSFTFSELNSFVRSNIKYIDFLHSRVESVITSEISRILWKKINELQGKTGSQPIWN